MLRAGLDSGCFLAVATTTPGDLGTTEVVIGARSASIRSAAALGNLTPCP